MPAKAGIQLCRATWNLKPTYNSFGVDNNRKTVRLSGFMGHGSQVMMNGSQGPPLKC
jgi:hypothetical protein